VALSDAGNYTAVASNSEGSASTHAAILTVHPDVTPPFVESVAATSATEVVVAFSEAVEDGPGVSGGENTANYSISNGVSVLSATLQPDRRMVVLTTTLMQQSSSYILTTNNINDRAATPNASSAQALSFSFSGAILIHIDFNGSASAPASSNQRIFFRVRID
jgi:hypothetical protein